MASMVAGCISAVQSGAAQNQAWLERTLPNYSESVAAVTAAVASHTGTTASSELGVRFGQAASWFGGTI